MGWKKAVVLMVMATLLFCHITGEFDGVYRFLEVKLLELWSWLTGK